jgi:hypothetical protein
MRMTGGCRPYIKFSISPQALHGFLMYRLQLLYIAFICLMIILYYLSQLPAVYFLS